MGWTSTQNKQSRVQGEGLIDDLQIYNRALSASEIEAIFLADSAGKCKVAPNQPSVADAGGPYQGNEGASIPLDVAIAQLDLNFF